MSIVLDNLTWIMSAVSLYCIFLSGSRDRKTWIITLVNQVVWVVWAIHDQSWGLIPLPVGIAILSVRGWVLWGKPEQRG